MKKGVHTPEDERRKKVSGIVARDCKFFALEERNI